LFSLLDYLRFSKFLTFYQAESRIFSNLFTKTQSNPAGKEVSCAAGFSYVIGNALYIFYCTVCKFLNAANGLVQAEVATLLQPV